MTSLDHAPHATDFLDRVERLAPREIEIGGLAARGLTNAQIGQRLYLSIDTVKTYMRRLFAKLDIAKRAQLATYFDENGNLRS